VGTLEKGFIESLGISCNSHIVDVHIQDNSKLAVPQLKVDS